VTDELRDADDVVVHVVADRLGVPDRGLVRLDERLEVLRASEAEAERAEPSRPAFSKVDGLPHATQIGGWGLE
jgi:hypothetical protein